MEMKTVEIINRITRLDSEVLPLVLLKVNDAICWLHHHFNDSEEIENCLENLGLWDKSKSYTKGILDYCGFLPNDETADDYIFDYFWSKDANRLEILKKQLIEWAIELEALEKQGL